MTSEEAQELYAEAAELLKEARQKAAAIALVIEQRTGDGLQTVCKRIAKQAGDPDSWEALRMTARRQKAAGQGTNLDGRANRQKSESHARMALRKGTKEERVASAAAILRDPDAREAVIEAFEELPELDKAKVRARVQPDKKIHRTPAADAFKEAMEPSEWLHQCLLIRTAIRKMGGLSSPTGELREILEIRFDEMAEALSMLRESWDLGTFDESELNRLLNEETS